MPDKTGVKRILRRTLATHGFLLEDKSPDDQCSIYNTAAILEVDGLTSSRLENPLLRSGLVLAGANVWLAGDEPPEEAEDGLLTAEDVATLDLLDTELVVLSACNTGLGDIRVGEGVMGLRRSFVVAGARTLVMSLWKVPDLATAVLMEQFYWNILKRSLPRDVALRDAQSRTRHITVGEMRESWLMPAVIDELSAGNSAVKRGLIAISNSPNDYRPFRHPYFWGAFTCQGDPSPVTANSGGASSTTC